MKTIALVAQKGGSGKTTLAIHLAGCALRQGAKVVLVDTDPQGSCGAWWRRRKAERPVLVEATAKQLPAVLESAREDGYDVALVDTAPHARTEAALAVRYADLALIPTRPSLLDVAAIGATVELVATLHGKAAIVLNGCPAPRLVGLQPGLVREARAALKGYGVAVAPNVIASRADFAQSLLSGRTVDEYEPEGRATKELAVLWRWVRKRLTESS